jgi:hypothetical protein
VTRHPGERTDWHDGAVRPVRTGFYERQYTHVVVVDWWDGETWWCGAPGRAKSLVQDLAWRGLASFHPA